MTDLRTRGRELCAFAAETIGRAPAAGWHRTGPTAWVLEIRAERQQWFVKQVTRTGVWQREVAAYAAWSDGLADSLPRLVAHCPERRTLLLTAVPGEPAAPHAAAAYRPAGHLLSRLHAQPMPRRPPAHSAARDDDPWLDYVGSLARQVESELVRLAGLGVDVDAAAVRPALAELRTLTPQPVVACHGDFLPRNWVGDGSHWHLIDLGMAGRRPAAAAFSRLHVRTLWDRPRLTTELLTGYARDLTADEIRCIELHRAVDAVVLMRWGARRGAVHAISRGHEVLAAVARDDALAARPGWR